MAAEKTVQYLIEVYSRETDLLVSEHELTNADVDELLRLLNLPTKAMLCDPHSVGQEHSEVLARILGRRVEQVKYEYFVIARAG